MHELPVGRGTGSLAELCWKRREASARWTRESAVGKLRRTLGDLETGKVLQSLSTLLLLTHRDPGVGDDNVGVLEGLLGRAGEENLVRRAELLPASRERNDRESATEDGYEVG